MNKQDKIYIAGHRGMAGSAIVRKLTEEGYQNLLMRTSAELDLRNQQKTIEFLQKEKPDYVFLALQKWAALWPTTLIAPNLFTIISAFRIT